MIERTAYYVAARLAEWAYTDSGIVLDRLKLEALLKEESVAAGYLPSDDECMEFICGADDGEPPAKLVRDFPKTNAYIEGYWE